MNPYLTLESANNAGELIVTVDDARLSKTENARSRHRHFLFVSVLTRPGTLPSIERDPF